MSETNSLLSHFLLRLQKDITRIDNLIQAVYNGQSFTIEIDLRPLSAVAALMVNNADDLLDVQFLLESGQIEAEDAALILSKVPGLASGGGGAVITGTPPSSKNSMGRSRSNTAVLAADVDGLQLAPPSYPSLENVMNNVPRSQQQPPAPKRQARALWDYNLNGEEVEDLSFEKGAIIEILREDNDDWWTGKSGGRTGIFPSNYAEILHHPLPTWSTAPPPVTAATARPAKHESAPKYMPMPYKAVHHPENAPNPTGTRPQQQTQQQQQHQETDDVKKSKYSHVKNTMANSAAGGLGFGAGAAIGGSVVRAIF